jgi:predicted nucleic acid-binding protein
MSCDACFFCIAALAHQIGAAVLTKNSKDFTVIRDKIDFEFESLD